MQITQMSFKEKIKAILNQGLSPIEEDIKVNEEVKIFIKQIREEIANGIVDKSHDSFIPLNEWCKLHGVNPVTARSWCLRERLEHIKIGKWLFAHPETTPPLQTRGRPIVKKD